ncbi:MAG: mycothiol transferase [Mycobacteriales bacterium]
MRSADLLGEAFDRIAQIVHWVVDDTPGQLLTFRADSAANSAAWLVWHLTRVQDDHIAEVAGRAQVWPAAGFADRFALPFEQDATGYGHSSVEVAAVPGDGRLLADYHDAVHEQTVAFVRTLDDEELERVVDTSWDPPVTLGARLISVVSDDLQHAGQAAYARGLADRA